MQLHTFSAPFDWSRIDSEIQNTGGVILRGLADARMLNAEVDRYLTTVSASHGRPQTGVAEYDDFLGHRTLRIHGLLDKIPATQALLGHPDLHDWALRAMHGCASSVLLSAGELIQIEPGEPRQAAHRDSDSWPIPAGEHPFVVNAIVALDDFTEANGATWIAPNSWRWPRERRAVESEYTRAVMQAGDAVLFRGDVVHRAGANESRSARRAISVSYCAGWLRPVENSFLSVDQQTVRGLSDRLQALLGYRAHDGASFGAGMVGLYENGDPKRALE